MILLNVFGTFTWTCSCVEYQAHSTSNKSNLQVCEVLYCLSYKHFFDNTLSYNLKKQSCQNSNKREWFQPRSCSFFCKRSWKWLLLCWWRSYYQVLVQTLEPLFVCVFPGGSLILIHYNLRTNINTNEISFNEFGHKKEQKEVILLLARARNHHTHHCHLKIL